MSFLEQFKEYAKNSGYEQADINMMTNNLKILNKITWSEELKSSANHIYTTINFNNIENTIVNTFFYDYDGDDRKKIKEIEKKINIIDDNGKVLVYKYKKDDYDDTITKLFIVEPFLEKNIKEIFENANKGRRAYI